MEQQLIDFFAKIKITEQVQAQVLDGLAKARNATQDDRKRARLTAQLDRSKKLFLVGGMSESDYLKAKGQIEIELGRLQPSAQSKVDVEEAVRLLNPFGGVLAQATPEELKLFFRTVLEEIYVKNRKIVSVKPRPNFYDLLCMSAVRPNGFGSHKYHAKNPSQELNKLPDKNQA